MNSFRDFLAAGRDNREFSTEDLVACLLPLFRQVATAHVNGLVAPLKGLDALKVDHSKVFFESDLSQPAIIQFREVRRIQRADQGPLNIVSQKQVMPDGTATPVSSEPQVSDATDTIEAPVYTTGYICWEQLVGHHDPLTDIFNLGQIMAAVALNLDFENRNDVVQFVKHRKNLFRIRADLHPVVARAIQQMTELVREERVQELSELIKALENYRFQEVPVSVDPDCIDGFHSRDLQGKQQVLLDRLQQRLFEISRRNRMLHFRQTMQSIDLTLASVPLSSDHSRIRDDQILVCNRDLERTIAEGRSLMLNRRLNFQEAIYLTPQLTRILRETRRDFAEYGFEQLRLVLCMLDWSNLKEDPQERFRSPLVLVPVKLRKKRGVRDSWELEPLSEDAEINPVVRYLFKRHFGIPLPERIDLEKTGLDELYRFLAQAIAESEPGVELAKIDRPRVDLLFAGARRKLERYRRKATVSGRGIRTWNDLSYSYDPATWFPLGIQMFSELTRIPDVTTAGLTAEDLPTRQFMVEEVDSGNDSIRDRQRPAVAVPAQETNDNPYNWSFDLCSVTLANFRYRKMSLVRDYEQLVAEPRNNAAFEAAFSLTPRQSDNALPETAELEDRYEVISCDPTQANSIARSRTGESYIIQGPPGTGKSQTITNLIADYAARGCRVLFVCEKRAAIDVVYARLKQCGLGDLGCLIHDSQADKKSFVRDLKHTYEAFLNDTRGLADLNEERRGILKRVADSLQPLQNFEQVMNRALPESDVPTSRLVERCIELQADVPDVPEHLGQRIPSWIAWQRQRSTLQRLIPVLERQVPGGVLAHHPLRNLSPELASEPNPTAVVTERLDHASRMLRESSEVSTENREWSEWTIAELTDLCDRCMQLKPLAEAGLLRLLDEHSEAAARLDQRRQAAASLKAILKQQQDQNRGWTNRIARRDLQMTIDVANDLSTKWFPFLRPAWWRLRKVMKRSYRLDSHPVKPTWVAVLTELKQEYQAEDTLQEFLNSAEQEFPLPGGFEAGIEWLIGLTDFRANDPNRVTALIHSWSQNESGAAQVVELAACQDLLRRLTQTLDGFLLNYQSLHWQALAGELDSIGKSLARLPDFLECLELLSGISTELQESLRTLPWPTTQIEAAAAHKSFREKEATDAFFRRFDQATRLATVEKLGTTHQTWMEMNARFVRQTVCDRFRENVRDSEAPANDASRDVEWQKAYSRGRKTLEHEFGKQMRYKSIRDLVSGDSGMVVKDLKPIWLMSPLGVSDTLPLEGQDFDVVIFDEASQITLESSIPALFRAGQTIVVGDEQQLPPTDFFSARNDSETDEEVAFQQDGETFIYDLESSSLLNHSARNLGSQLLGWHYRSRDEALISFSNWAFYGGRLLTIPEESLLAEGTSLPSIESAENAESAVAALSDRPISFHHLTNGVYLNRRNRPEAEYIAALLRELLKQEDGRTFGVIAFSEAQQDEIEKAIDRLAAEDADFSNRVEAERVREEDGQFNGLLVKNLENIQGDERDVIILAVCYGPDDTGRMIMNFGPINKSGGEKRLNVAFSRAKHHMAIVSTIRYSAITNEYNQGANCLRNYLRYAEAVSDGDASTARTVLQGLNPWLDETNSEKPVPEAVREIAKRIEAEGFQIDFNIGHSDFRCDMGVRMPGDPGYRLGILVDAGAYYQTGVETIDRELFRPRLLQIFGWNVQSILMTDWIRDPDRVVQQIVQQCRKQG